MYDTTKLFKITCQTALSVFLVLGAPQSRAESLMAPTPPMGWNSYDSYGTYLHEKAAMENLKVFVEKFKPLGYDYFVLDGGWYIEYETQPGTLFPTTDKADKVNLNADGYFIPSKVYFPNGLKALADECHRNGVKFGMHILRGIPRRTVELNTPIKGTSYHAADIANTVSTCPWNPHTYGVDMSKPGAQEWYDGYIQLLADTGVDFIKADDIVTYPAEIAAVQKAIAQCGRKILLSLSPGNRVMGSEIKLYEQADMLRVTGDVWDEQVDIDKCFDAWLTWQNVPVREGFWFDMDMIPFGELQVMIPEGTTRKMAGEGVHRFDRFSLPQKESFITMRAMSASPLMMGGMLASLDRDSLQLLTNRDMIACNQNGVVGHLTSNGKYLQCWKTPQKSNSGRSGWVAVFNRSSEKNSGGIGLKDLGLKGEKKYRLHDIWGNKPFKPGKVDLDPNGCIFIAYEEI